VRRRFGSFLATSLLFLIAFLFLGGGVALADESDLAIPDLKHASFKIGGASVTAYNLLLYGAMVITGTLGISLWLRRQIRPQVHAQHR